MATKAKTLPQPAPAVTLESRLSEAIKAMETGKADAQALLTALEQDAMAAERLTLARTSRNYLLALARRNTPMEAQAEAGPEIDATMLLNRRDYVGALALVDKGLELTPQRAQLHFMKAIALVKTARPDLAAESLRTAVSLQRDLVYQYQLEPDFNPVRHNPAFVEFELA